MSHSTVIAVRELIVRRHYDFPCADLYKAWIDLRLSLKWWGSEGYVATHVQIDLRPGGSWSGRFRKLPAATEYRAVGIIHEVVPNTRIIYTFAWEEMGERGPDTLVILSFAEIAPARTRLTIHQRPFRTREERDDYRDAWEQTLDRFAACLNDDQRAMSNDNTRQVAE